MRHERVGFVESAAIALAVTVIAAVAPAQGFTPDSIDVQIVDRELVVVGSAGGSRARLRDSEQMIQLEARGTVAGVLTDQRFFAISTRSLDWQEAALSRHLRTGTPTLLVGANLVLCLAESAALFFPGGPAVIGEVTFSAGESPVEYRVNEHVGIVITTRRIVGFSSANATAQEERFRAGERLVSPRVLPTLASVRTSKRLLSFRGSWTAENL